MDGATKELLSPDNGDPMVVKFQETMTKHLQCYLEKLTQQLEERRNDRKDEQTRFQDLENAIINLKVTISKKRLQLDECNVLVDESRGKFLKAQEEAKKVKTRLDEIRNEKRKLENEARQKRAELDDLRLQLNFAQKHDAALHGDVQAAKNFNLKSTTQKRKAMEQKLRQDWRVERLTQELERVTEQINMHDAHIAAQSETKERAQENRGQVELLLEDMVMNHKLLEQKSRSRLHVMEKALQGKNALHEELCAAMQQVSLLDREAEMRRKSNAEKQEKNEKLSLELQIYQNKCENLKREVRRRKEEEEALLAQASAFKSSLKEAEKTLLSLKEEHKAAESELNNHRLQLKKERQRRLELEGTMKAQTQQISIQKRIANNYQQNFSKLTDVKTEKMSQVAQLENKIAAAEKKRKVTSQKVDALNVTLQTQEREIAEKTKHLQSREAHLRSLCKEMDQDLRTIERIRNKMAEIVARTGEEDFNLFETKLLELKSEKRQLEATIKDNIRLWLMRQEIRVRLNQDYEATNKVIQKLQTDYATLQKTKTCQDALMDIENRHLQQLQKQADALLASMNKINIKIHENGKEMMQLKEKKMMMEVDFIGRLQRAEQEAAGIQMKCERTREEKEKICKCLRESEKQILIWKEKIQLNKRARSEWEKKHKEIQELKMDVRKKEAILGKKLKQGERLMRECEVEARRQCSIFDGILALHFTSAKIKHNRKCETERKREAQKRERARMKKQLRRLDQEIQELRQERARMVEEVEVKQQQLTEKQLRNQGLDSEIRTLQDDRARSQQLTVALQTWAQHLRRLRDGTSKAPAPPEAAAAAFGREVEYLHSLHHRLLSLRPQCPKKQEKLRKLRLAVEAHVMFVEI